MCSILCSNGRTGTYEVAHTIGRRNSDTKRQCVENYGDMIQNYNHSQSNVYVLWSVVMITDCAASGSEPKRPAASATISKAALEFA